MKINYVLGIGKILPLDKLIDVISIVTGRVTEKYFVRKDIDSKAYRISVDALCGMRRETKAVTNNE